MHAPRNHTLIDKIVTITRVEFVKAFELKKHYLLFRNPWTFSISIPNSRRHLVRVHKRKEWTALGARPAHNFCTTDSRTANFYLEIKCVSAKVVRHRAETSAQTRFLFHPSNNGLTALVSRFKMMKSRHPGAECGTLRLMVIVIKRSAAVMGRERF